MATECEATQAFQVADPRFYDSGFGFFSKPSTHASRDKMANNSHKHSSHRKLHKDWRVWLALLLMVAAILMYVLSLDDSIIPR